MLDAMPARILATVITLVVAVWCFLTIGVCVATSHVICGLRQEVRNIRKRGQYTKECHRIAVQKL